MVEIWIRYYILNNLLGNPEILSVNFMIQNRKQRSIIFMTNLLGII